MVHPSNNGKISLNPTHRTSFPLGHTATNFANFIHTEVTTVWRYFPYTRLTFNQITQCKLYCTCVWCWRSVKWLWALSCRTEALATLLPLLASLAHKQIVLSTSKTVEYRNKACSRRIRTHEAVVHSQCQGMTLSPSNSSRISTNR